MQKKTHYANGQKIFEQKGNVLTYFFKTGVLKAKGKLVNGLMEGRWIFNRESGKLWQVGNFKKGVKQGSWVRYSKTGKVEYEADFINDKVAKPASKVATKVHTDTKKYNAKLSLKEKKICDTLAREIAQALPKAENKIWHANPVWFIDGNPIVGYDKLKDSVRLLFWSGQSFEEKGLHKEGSFKAAEVRYTDSKQINLKDLKRWLKKSQKIQWDYKNIVKRKGVLKKLV
jgi:hypothetical protein